LLSARAHSCFFVTLCAISSPDEVDTALEVRSLQLSVAQFGHRYDLSGNGQTALLTLLGDFLRRCGVLHNERRQVSLPTVPLRLWQNRSDRLRTQLLNSDDLGVGHFDGLRFYAMCPDTFCGKLHPLEAVTRHLPNGSSLRCDRKLISERTEWPLDCDYHGTPRPNWNTFKDTDGKPEPVCGQPLTLSYNPLLPADSPDQSREPATVFTYRELRAGVRSLLARDGVQDRCERWRHGRTPADLREAAFSPLHEMRDVYDGQLWRDMQYWPPLEQQHQRVPTWWEPHWQHRRDAAAAGAAAAAASSSYKDTYDGRLLAAPGTIALQLFVD
jgi:hypothetical protein